jgi:hypothetical protein
MSRARIGCLALALTCAGAGLEACAADPGDALKGGGDGGGASGDDGPAIAVGTGADAGATADDTSAPEPDAPALDDAAGTGAGDSAGDAPAPGAPGAVDAPPEAATCAACPLTVLYATPTTAPSTDEIRPHFEIQNTGASAQDMSVLTLRYWYTAQGSASQAYDCDYAMVGCGAVQATFAAATAPTAAADHYMEVSFTAGSIAPGESSGEIQTRFHDTGYAVTFDQTKDYSFDAADTAYAQWNQVTLYRNGTLVWGVEP